MAVELFIIASSKPRPRVFFRLKCSSIGDGGGGVTGGMLSLLSLDRYLSALATMANSLVTCYSLSRGKLLVLALRHLSIVQGHQVVRDMGMIDDGDRLRGGVFVTYVLCHYGMFANRTRRSCL